MFFIAKLTIKMPQITKSIIKHLINIKYKSLTGIFLKIIWLIVDFDIFQHIEKHFNPAAREPNSQQM